MSPNEVVEKVSSYPNPAANQMKYQVEVPKLAQSVCPVLDPQSRHRQSTDSRCDSLLGSLLIIECGGL
jgi:hypothetical protein